MEKADDTLKVLCTQMINITCSSHGLNRTVEQLRIEFSKKVKLIANVKNYFKKHFIVFGNSILMLQYTTTEPMYWDTVKTGTYF